MKKVLITFLSTFLICFSVVGQNDEEKSDDMQRISITPVYHTSKFTEKDGSLLINKMNKLVSKDGLSSNYSRFIMWPRVDELSLEPTSTVPVMYVAELDVTFYIGDNITQTIYGQVNFTVEGVDRKSEKAKYKALKNIKSTNSECVGLLKQAKEKIIEFYNSNCDFIIKEAHTLAKANKHDAAIYKLTSVPNVCKECYDQCMDAVGPIYQQKIDRDCQMKLSKAEGIWNASQDMRAAKEAGYILSTIEPGAACFKKAFSLSKKIEKKVSEIDKREWEYILTDQSQESERIQAIRDIGVAYGENQEPTGYLWISRY